MSCHAVAGQPSGRTTPRSQTDSGIRICWAGLADLELVGSPPENDLPFPNGEVGDVWAAPREERGVEFGGVTGTQLLGVKNGIHHIPVR